MKFKHFVLLSIILIVDQLVKFFILNKKITIIPNFIEFNYTENVGGAFGIGNFNWILLLSILIIIGIVLYIIFQKDDNIIITPLVLILGGSLGNLIDRIFRGYVIDYIDVNVFDFPNFNIADICIFFGCIILIIKLITNLIINKKDK